jgi:hypothetical protein
MKSNTMIPMGYASREEYIEKTTTSRNARLQQIGEEFREYITPVHLKTIQKICSDITKQSEQINNQIEHCSKYPMDKRDGIPYQDYLQLKNYIKELNDYMGLLELRANGVPE